MDELERLPRELAFFSLERVVGIWGLELHQKAVLAARLQRREHALWAARTGSTALGRPLNALPAALSSKDGQGHYCYRHESRALTDPPIPWPAFR